MRYFAMINGTRQGPFDLNQLVEAGVGPDTYVWCKGMKDWEKAEDVADICRYFRQHIFDLMHPGHRPAIKQQAAPEPSQPVQIISPRQLGEEAPHYIEPDTTVPPSPTIVMAILMTVFCFPPTGFIAIYYSCKAGMAWKESQRGESKQGKPLYTDAEREENRRRAHDYDRNAKMWVGITFFLGMILYAFIGKKFF